VIADDLRSVLGIGLALGFRHALEPDHVAAVTTLAGQQARLRDAWRLAVAWSFGHTATVALVAVAAAALGLRLPETLWPVADLVVGLTLVALGGSVLVRWARGRWHVHAHAHDGVSHLHLHSHAHGAAHSHRHPAAGLRWALGIGLLHGLAGSGAILALLVASAPTRAAQGSWLATFGIGTVVGMLVVSSLVFGVIRAGSRRGTAWVAALRLTAAMGAVAVGAMLALHCLSEL
jgi:hypothetical protein